MDPIANKSLTALESKLALLLAEIKGTPEFERARAWVARMTGGRALSEYLRDESVTVKDRAALADSLIEILLTRAWDRLPEAEPGAEAPAVQVAEGPGAPNGGVMTVSPESGRVIAMPEDPPEDSMTPEEVRRIVRRELAAVLLSIAKVLNE